MRLGVAAAVVEGVLVEGDVEVADGRIAGVGLAGGGSGTAVPGFVDLQVNGFAGVDFASADADAYRRAGEALLATGVTAFQPTLITAPEHDLVAALAEVPAEPIGARILGIHLEGPFLSPNRPGTHPPEAIRDPDRALLERLLDAGPVTYLTLAPERPGALELVDVLHARGVTVSFGHSDATAAEAHAGFDRGVRTVTHLFNAMRPFAHRDPGIAGAALARDDVTVQLIVDGHHLADEAVVLARRAARGRFAVVTDAMAAAGVGDGVFRLGAVEVEVRDGVARRGDGVLAGSVVTIPQSLRNLVALEVPLVEAVAAVTRAPARVLNDDTLGVLRLGGAADLVVLDDDLEIRTVLVAGREEVAA
jgi:N-acetylglucosamine-6-phosphate deacetylase